MNYDDLVKTNFPVYVIKSTFNLFKYDTSDTLNSLIPRFHTMDHLDVELVVAKMCCYRNVSCVLDSFYSFYLYKFLYQNNQPSVRMTDLIALSRLHLRLLRTCSPFYHKFSDVLWKIDECGYNLRLNSHYLCYKKAQINREMARLEKDDKKNSMNEEGNYTGTNNLVTHEKLLFILFVGDLIAFMVLIIECFGPIKNRVNSLSINFLLLQQKT